MIKLALDNRSELRDVDYRRRINAEEARAALLEMLPGIQLFAGTNQDANSYLLNSNWMSYGARASWNLLKVFQYPARRDLVDGQERALDQRGLALTMAIMTQVYVGRARITHFNREVAVAKTYADTQNELLASIRAEHAANKVSEQTLLREELNAAVGQVRLDIARVSLETAKANLLSSVGLDPRTEGTLPSTSVGQLAGTMRRGGAVPALNGSAVTLTQLKE